MQIYLQTPPQQGESSRFYHILLQQDLLGGWSLIREWGVQGRPGRVRREHHPTWESAEAAMIRLRDDRLGRGYHVVFIQGERRPA